MIETFSGLIAVVLTLSVLSYLVADNPVYRSAVYLFIGLSAGYAVVLAWYLVLQPQLGRALSTALTAEADLGLIAGALGLSVLGLLLPLKTLGVGGRPVGWLGSLVVAFMVGIGAAVAVGGAVTGTLFPQASATAVSLLPFGTGARMGELAVEGIFILVGTLATLGFFYYGARAEPGSPAERPALVRPVAAVGQVFIGIAFGVLYAGALAASIAVFTERMGTLWNFFVGGP